MAGLAGLEGLLNLLLRKAEGLADFGEIDVFIYETFKMRRICSRRDGKLVTLLFFANHQTRLRVFNYKPRFRQDKSETWC